MYPAKDGVLVVKPGSWHSGDEELAAVGVGAGIGHTQREWAVMPQAAIKLILELLTPNGRATSAVTYICVTLGLVKTQSLRVATHSRNCENENLTIGQL